MNRFFCDQHWSTPLKHHSTLRRLGDNDFPPTKTHTGFECEEAKMRIATQLLRSSLTSKATSRMTPSATKFVFATGKPLTITSSGTSCELPIRARSRCQ